MCFESPKCLKCVCRGGSTSDPTGELTALPLANLGEGAERMKWEGKEEERNGKDG